MAYIADTDALGLRTQKASRSAGCRAARLGDDRGDPRADPGPDRRRPRLPGQRRRLLPRAQLWRYGKLSNRDPEEMDQGEEAVRPRSRGSARLRPLERAQGGGGTSWPSPWAKVAPLAHRVLSDVGEGARPTSRSTAAASTWSSLITRTRSPRPRRARRALARVWMHNGMVQIDEEKMSKSSATSSSSPRRSSATAARPWSPTSPQATTAAARLLREQLTEAAASVERIRNYLRRAPGGEPEPFVQSTRSAFLEALSNDFNTPQRSHHLFGLINEGNKRELSGARPVAGGAAAPARSRLPAGGGGGAPAEAERLLADREEARSARDFDRAARCANQLAEMGWEVRDEAGGARLVRRG